MAHTPEVYKICTSCELSIVISDFVLDKRAKDGHGSWCKFCKNEKNIKWAKENRQATNKIVKRWRQNNKEKVAQAKSEWRKNNKEKHLEQKRKWNKNNKEKSALYSAKRRALKRSGDIALVTATDMKKLYSKDCIYCGSKGEQIDHVIPLSRGGRHAIGNLASSCTKCNQSKGSKFVMEWKNKGKV